MQRGYLTMNNNNENNNKPTDDDLLEHDFDGIKEKNAPIPTWFNLLLYGSIVFAVIYMIYYHVMQDGQSIHHEEAISMGKATDNSSNQDYDYLASSKDAKILAHAKTIFDTNCASCHGLHGEGGVGPNLTDDYWIHGDTYKDVERVINDGIIDKGMPAWGNLLGKKAVNELVAYIISIQETNPQNAKKAEGVHGKLHQ